MVDHSSRATRPKAELLNIFNSEISNGLDFMVRPNQETFLLCMLFLSNQVLVHFYLFELKERLYFRLTQWTLLCYNSFVSRQLASEEIVHTREYYESYLLPLALKTHKECTGYNE